jgi:hypothetical protein
MNKLLKILAFSVAIFLLFGCISNSSGYSSSSSSSSTASKGAFDNVSDPEEKAYLEATYGREENLVQLRAAIANLWAKGPNNLLGKYLEEYPNNNLLQNMTNLQDIFDRIMYGILGYWSDSIKSDKYVSTSVAMSILFSEYKRQGVYDNVNKCMDLIINDIKPLNKSQKSNTINLYAVLSQYQDAIVNVSGSFNSYQQNMNTFGTDFSKSLSLAKLEW